MTPSRTAAPVLLAAATALALFALAGFQVTGATVGPRFLGRLVGSMIEVDRWLAAHRDDLVRQANDRTRPSVEVAGLPLRVSLSAGVVLRDDPGAIREAILAAAGARVYREGLDAFRDDAGRRATLASTEPVRWTISLLEDGTHGFWTLALVATLVGAAALGALTSISRPGAGLRTALKAAVIGAAVSAVMSAIVWSVASLVEGALSSAVDREIALIVHDGAWVGVRNAAAVAAAGLAGLLLWSFVSRGPAESESWPGALDETV